MLKVGMAGLGRTGEIIARKIAAAPDMELVLALAGPGSSKSGRDVGRFLGGEDCGVKIVTPAQLGTELRRNRPDVVVDFTSPEATLENLKEFGRHHVNLVVGTTGFTPEQHQVIRKSTELFHFGVAMAPNITGGVNLMMFLTRLLAGFWPESDVEIVETHHCRKEDSPSGTALKIAASVREGRGGELMLLHGRKGRECRRHGEIGLHSVRGGGVVGRHEVMFLNETDKITIAHESFSREVFADGALLAVRYMAGRRGLYSMEDVLGLKQEIMTGEAPRVKEEAI